MTHRRPSLVVRGLLVALVVGYAGYLGVRAYQDWQSLQRPAAARAQDTSRIRPWMSVRFIANGHAVNVAALAARLDAAPDGHATLIDLAQARGVPVAAELDQARRAVADLRAASPDAPPATPRASSPGAPGEAAGMGDRP